MNLLRYKSEVVDVEDYELPGKSASDYRISPREMEMAQDLIQSMSGKWKPEDYHDEFRAKLRTAIEKRLKSKGVTATVEEEERTPENAATNVVDFMALLKKSIGAKTRTPAARNASAGDGGGKKPAAKKSTAKKSATKKTAAKKATKKTASRKAPARRRAG
jgi:DNA end-binding protein Ku